MVLSEVGVFIPPREDGRIKRPWIVDGEERCRSATERVAKLFWQRPWVTGEIIETVRNGPDDMRGVDLFVPMRRDLIEILGIVSESRGVPIQVKSCDRAVVDFLIEREIYFGGGFEFKDGHYIFTFNGQNPEELIVADMVGQMLALSKGVVDEDDFLDYLGGNLNDGRAVQSWFDQRVVIEDSWWYRHMLVES